MSQSIISAMEERLRFLDSQHIWLANMIDELNLITTPPTNRRLRILDPPTPSDISLSSEFEEESLPDTQSEDEDDDDDLETIVYHNDRWGFYPMRVDEGYDSDDETVVGEWEDPFKSPLSDWKS